MDNLYLYAQPSLIKLSNYRDFSLIKVWRTLQKLNQKKAIMKKLLFLIILLWSNIIFAQVTPLINNNWQTYQWPYNAYYPESTGGVNGRMGNSCWITAMARVVHYWEYPENRRGTLDFTDYAGYYWYCNYEELNLDYSQMSYDNDLPVFCTLNNGQGYKAGKPIVLKVWGNSTQSLIPFEYSMTDPYNEAYLENIYPEEDGLYSVIKITKGIQNIENLIKTISIFPNPSEGIFNISIEDVSGKVQMKVFDVHGNDYRFFEIEGTSNMISEKLDLNELAAGVYFISFSGKDFSEVKKIVIQ